MLGICTKCHALMPLTRHHVKPRSKGGGDESENIRLCCRPCHDELDLEVGVRQLRQPKKRKRRGASCIKCNGFVPMRGVRLGIMSAAEAAGLCQRCAWERERNLWHELRKKIEEAPVIENPRLDRLIRDAGIANRVTVH